MLQPLSTLPLSKSAIFELNKAACRYVEDVSNAQDSIKKYNGKLLQQTPTSISALDLWQEELQRNHMTTCSDILDSILDGGFNCKEITEICGAHGSGKSQICMQMSIMSQLPEECGGLNGQSLYIDTRNGFSPTRIIDMIKGCQKRFPHVPINSTEILKGIKVVSPRSFDEFRSVINSLKRHFSIDTKIRVVIIDSLSFPVQCSANDGWQRTESYFRIFHELHKISSRYNIAIIVVNELCSHIDSKGKVDYANAGGQLAAHFANKRLVIARLTDFTFAARISKASTIPQISAMFSVTEDGIRDGKSQENQKHIKGEKST